MRNTTTPSSPNYVPPERRFATFDQDGTTWVEPPIYSQVVFAFDRVVARRDTPEWKTTTSSPSLVTTRAAMAKFTDKDLIAIMIATHTGMSVEASDDCQRLAGQSQRFALAPSLH